MEPQPPAASTVFQSWWVRDTIQASRGRGSIARRPGGLEPRSLLSGGLEVGSYVWSPQGCRPSACRTDFWRLWGVCFPVSSSCGSVQSHVGEKALEKERLTQRRTSSPLSASSYLLSTQFPASPNGPDLLITSLPCHLPHAQKRSWLPVVPPF